MTEQPLPLDVQPAVPIRPPHYLLITSEFDYDREEYPLPTVMWGSDDEDYVRNWAESDNGSESVGAWDNWFGRWLVEPKWADMFEVTAEGFTRYDLRPEGIA